MTKADVAWVAGIMEGEGSFSMIKANPNAHRRTPQVYVSMTDRDVIERVAAIFAAITGSDPILTYERKRQGRKDMYRVKVSQRDAVNAVILALFPYLGERRQAEAANCLELNQQRKETTWYRNQHMAEPELRYRS